MLLHENERIIVDIAEVLDIRPTAASGSTDQEGWAWLTQHASRICTSAVVRAGRRTQS